MSSNIWSICLSYKLLPLVERKSYVQKSFSLLKFVEKRRDHKIDIVSFFLCWKTGSFLNCISHLSTLTRLDLSRSPKLNNNGILNLATLTSLRSLNLKNCWRLNNDAAYALASLTRLEELILHGLNSLTDQGIILFTRLSTLTSLDLSNCWSITESSLECLYSNLTHLKILRLSGTIILQNRDYCCLSLIHSILLPLILQLTLPIISVLGCYNVKNLNGISHLSKLTVLDLTEVSNLTSSVMNELTSLRNLQELNLSHVFSLDRSHLTSLSPYINIIIEDQRYEATKTRK